MYLDKDVVNDDLVNGLQTAKSNRTDEFYNSQEKLPQVYIYMLYHMQLFGIS